MAGGRCVQGGGAGSPTDHQEVITWTWDPAVPPDPCPPHPRLRRHLASRGCPRLPPSAAPACGSGRACGNRSAAMGAGVQGHVALGSSIYEVLSLVSLCCVFPFFLFELLPYQRFNVFLYTDGIYVTDSDCKIEIVRNTTLTP